MFKNLIKVILIPAIILCGLAFYNKFPIVYSDCGTYIRSGFTNEVPDDRPLHYGFFIRHVSLSASVWLVIFAQALITAWMLYRFAGLIIPQITQRKKALIPVLLLSTITGLSLNVSSLLPDIFVPVSFLAFIILLTDREAGRLERIAMSCMLVFTMATHLSNLPILLMLLIVFWGMHLMKRPSVQYISRRRLFQMSIVLVAGILFVPLFHGLLGGKWQFSKGTHVFLMSRMIENGIAEKYLDRTCPVEPYKLCAFKDSLPYNFIWDGNSPLYKTGGWEANKDEYQAIIKGILTTPHFALMFIQKSIEGTFKQFFSFNCTYMKQEIMQGVVVNELSAHFPAGDRDYYASEQVAGRLDFSIVNQIQYLLVVGSMLVLFFYLSGEIWEKSWSLARCVGLWLMLYLLFSAFVCSTLSTVDARYQNRIAWLLPVFICLVAWLHYVARPGARKGQ